MATDGFELGWERLFESESELKDNDLVDELLLQASQQYEGTAAAADCTAPAPGPPQPTPTPGRFGPFRIVDDIER